MTQSVRVLSLFFDVAFHTSAERGIKLSEITDLHGWAVASQFVGQRLGVEVFRSDADWDRLCAGNRGVQLFSDVRRSAFRVQRLAFGVWRLTAERRTFTRA